MAGSRTSWGEIPDFDEFLQILRAKKPELKGWVNVLVGSLRIKSGITTGRVFTDGWPDFAAVLCQINDTFSSVNRLFECFVLKQHDDVMDSLVDQIRTLMDQEGTYWIVTDDARVVEVLSQLKLRNSTSGVAVHNMTIEYRPLSYCLLDNSLLTQHEPLVSPDTYVLKKLNESHAEQVAAFWEVFVASDRTAFFSKLIKRYHSVGVFLKSPSGQVSDSPIGWCLQYSTGKLAHLFVKEQYRRKGLAKMILKHMCHLITDNGEIPLAWIKKDNMNSIALFESIGFVEVCN